MTEEKEKLEWKEQVLKYTGKTLNNSGTKDGNEWKAFKLTFDTGGEYPFTLNAWGSLGDKEDSTSLKLKELEEGNYYLMKYKVQKDAFKNKGGKLCDNRTVWHITLSDEDSWAKDKEKQLAERNQVVKEVSKEEVFKHFEAYLAKNFTKGVESTAEQCIRSWFLNNYTEEYRLVKTEIKNHFFKAEEEKDVRLQPPVTAKEEEVKEDG